MTTPSLISLWEDSVIYSTNKNIMQHSIKFISQTLIKAVVLAKKGFLSK